MCGNRNRILVMSRHEPPRKEAAAPLVCTKEPLKEVKLPGKM